MDLSRWKISRLSPRLAQITSRYRDFQEFLGDVLEGERGFSSQTQSGPSASVAPPFSIELDYGKMYSLAPTLRRSSEKNKNLLLLERLAPFFEAGFLVRRSIQTHRLRSMFLFGKSFAPNRGQEQSVRLNLPFIPTETVMSGRVRPVLKAFDLEVLLSRHPELLDAQVFAFSLQGEKNLDESIILICNRPHPWQQLAVEAAATSTFAAVHE
jgi:hypothetical protein